jgi:hypothetical protein
LGGLCSADAFYCWSGFSSFDSWFSGRNFYRRCFSSHFGNCRWSNFGDSWGGFSHYFASLAGECFGFTLTTTDFPWIVWCAAAAADGLGCYNNCFGRYFSRYFNACWCWCWCCAWRRFSNHNCVYSFDCLYYRSGYRHFNRGDSNSRFRCWCCRCFCCWRASFSLLAAYCDNLCCWLGAFAVVLAGDHFANRNCRGNHCNCVAGRGLAAFFGVLFFGVFFAAFAAFNHVAVGIALTFATVAATTLAA